ncbi:MFS transporter [Pseudalkalibacillus berkeleyi]|uniref:MFS transporter n=1 Tax=Pseudalkalibacillus berkeleyi TaxID=1069813 RepID=A0ABS9H235_9BACL|nr:MFS transporter [Pseudalkalibacillus berkeleyi]MCF6139039.1 MFS transporter [Pseudalkalibacillus berkeleyi]
MNYATEKQSHSYKRTIMILSVAVLLVVMNTTMFNVALPTILRDFNLSASEGAWIVSGYSIVLAICTITYTRLSDYLPIRGLLITGIGIFGIASILGIFASSFAWLLVARLCQAAGAAAIPGLSMVFASRYIPKRTRGQSMSMIASAASFGFGLGPVVGGWMTNAFDWNYLFIVTLFVLMVIPILFNQLPTEGIRKGQFDVLGGILTGVTITSFLLFISTREWYFIASFLVLAYVLWLRISRAEIPFIQPKLIQNRGYRKLLYISFLGFCTHFAILLLMPIMLEQIYGKSPSLVGMIIFPGAMFSAVAAIYVGRLIDRYGNIRVMVWAAFLLGLSTLIFGFLSPINEYMIMVGYMFTSFGFSSLSSSSTNEVTQILPKEQAAAGIGMKQLTQFVGSATGAVLGGILLELNDSTYTLFDFQFTFFTMAFLMTIAFLFLLSYKKKVASA